MNISRYAARHETSVSPAWEKVAKPAVLKVTDSNRLFSIFCGRGISPNVCGFRNSTANMNTVPAAIRTPVRVSTSLVCSLKRRMICDGESPFFLPKVILLSMSCQTT